MQRTRDRRGGHSVPPPRPTWSNRRLRHKTSHLHCSCAAHFGCPVAILHPQEAEAQGNAVSVHLALAHARFASRQALQFRIIEREFSRDGEQRSSSSVHRDVRVCHVGTRQRPTTSLRRKVPPIPKENIMRGRVMMILASAVLAGSLLATGAQARGGGGGGGHGGGFGGGHMGGFGGGHMGGFGGGHMAGMRGDHFGYRGRHFARGGLYGDGLGCPYYTPYTWPYNCTY